jgi:phosphate transport system protein
MNITSDDLREMTLKTASIVETILEKSLKENTTKKEIFALENEINKAHTSIDDSVFKYIALNQPTAIDLRIALAVMKINSQLERIGDQAVNIKRNISKITQPFSEINSISEEVRVMLKNSIDAFVSLDSKRAADVIHQDIEVNDLYKEIMTSFIKKMKKDTVDFDDGFYIIRIAKCLERIGDLTTNIAEDIIFLESGTDIRHNPEVKFNRRKGDKKEGPNE